MSFGENISRTFSIYAIQAQTRSSGIAWLTHHDSDHQILFVVSFRMEQFKT